MDNALSRGFFDGITTFPTLLQEAGYKTIFSGKWHVSGYESPLDRGFDEVLSEFISNYGRSEVKNEPILNIWNDVYSGKKKIDKDEDYEGEKTFGRIIRPGYPTYHQFSTDDNPFGDTTTVELACEHIKL